MSSDGAMDKPRSARPAREDRGLAGIALVVLLVLALVATVVMVFSDNPVWTRIGTLAALWAAFIGAFLVARYRRLAASEAARVRDLHTVYELQLEREISARREHELVVEKELRDSVRTETSDSVHALRLEIAALREQLGQLGVTIPEDRFAVGGHAPAGQLGAGSSLPSVPSERVQPRRRAPEAPADAATPSRARTSEARTSTTHTPEAATPDATAAGVGRDATPSTERTEKLSAVAGAEARPAESRSAEARPAESRTDKARGPAVRPATRARAEATKPEATPATSGSAPTRSDSAQPAPAEPARAGTASAESAPAGTAPAESAPAEAAPSSRHGEGGGLSVAELMARFGEDAPSGSRRRRHAAE